MARAKHVSHRETYVHDYATAVGMSGLITSIVYYVMGVIESLLALRLIFKLAAANPGSPFVSFIYSITKPLIYPFTGIFPTASGNLDYGRSLFEPATLVAMIVYPILAYVITRLFTITDTARETEDVNH